jgi:puromycin-sensitive aminopeptidase
LQTYRPCEVVLDGEDEILVLVFDEVLSVGDGVLEIDFSGALNQHLKGLYKWYLFFFLYIYIYIYLL